MILDILAILVLLAYIALIGTSLHLSRSSAPVDDLYRAVALELIAGGSQLVSFSIVVLSGAYGWVSVVLSGFLAAVGLVAAGFTWARASRMEATR